MARCSIALLLVLAGCASKPAVSALPPLVHYSRPFMSELLAEQPKIRACCPNGEQVIKDYSQLRDMIRAGQKISGAAAP